MVPNQLSYAHIWSSIVIYIFHETQKYHQHIFLIHIPWSPMPIYGHLLLFRDISGFHEKYK